MARRRRYHKVRPDMGWIVGATNVAFTVGSSDQATQSATLFDFGDVDPEALTGRIEADKSDWFIKRFILNGYANCSLDGLNPNDITRFFEWGLSVATVENTNSVLNQNLAIFSAEWYNLQARILRTGVEPVYMPGVLPFGVGNPSNEIGLMTVNGNEIPANGGADPVGWLPTGPFWGPAKLEADQTVVAGLRNNQTVELAVSTCEGPGALDWTNGDSFTLVLHYQFLMQKRRA